MERIDFIKLRGVINDRASATRYVKNSTHCYPEYNLLLSNYIVKHNQFREKESALHIMSMQNWLLKKEVQTSTTTPCYGQIWFADLGSNYMPECSYSHPVLILEMIGNMVLVIPSTTSPQYINDAYHPNDNDEGNKFFRKVGVLEGFVAPCALILSNVRAISLGRLLDLKGTMPGVNDPTKSSVFWEIKDRCFEFCFPKKKIEIYNLKGKVNQMEKEKNEVQQKNDEKKSEIKSPHDMNNELLLEIENLKKEIEKYKEI